MPASDQAGHLKLYSTPEVVAQYARMDFLTACEQHVFDKYLHPGMAILDLGVGGGRTTPYLSPIASRYVGVDYSEEMVLACRNRFPDLEFKTADAADLSLFSDASFDAVIFSFNGLDCLAPYAKRESCLRECHRVLKRGGIFIFSTHNPRSLFLEWQWDRERLRKMASKVASQGLLFHLSLAALTTGRVALSVARSCLKAIPRARRRLPSSAFWRGSGYIVDPSSYGAGMYCGIPDCVTSEVTRTGFQLLQVVPENYPGKTYEYSTRWYYYAASKG